MHLKMSKVCLVTGVGPETGTGAEIAKYFSENGFHVAMIARSEDNLKRLESKLSLIHISEPTRPY